MPAVVALRAVPRRHDPVAHLGRAGAVVLTLHRVTAGHGYTYLTRQVAAHDDRVRAGGLDASYPGRGEAPGRWLGGGLAGVGIRPGAAVSEAQMIALFGHGRHPDEALLRARVRADGGDRAAAEAGTALGRPFPRGRRGAATVAGFDLTFSPVKSVSTLWALAPLAAAGVIEAAHASAVTATVRWLEGSAALTRVCTAGRQQQVPVRGFVAAAFAHRDSRTGDPQLHTHVAVSSKGQLPDGRWRALDSRALYRSWLAASWRYDSHLEAELRARLGVDFAPRAGPGSPSEILGVDPRLLAAWSSRRHAIDRRLQGLSAEFRREWARDPDPVESIRLAQRATLQTRPGKHGHRRATQQRHRWAEQAAAVLGTGGVEAMLAGVRAAGAPTPHREPPGPDVVAALAESVITAVQSRRARWRRWQVSAEAYRQARTLRLAVPLLDPTVDRVVAAALHQLSVPAPSGGSRPRGVSPWRDGDWFTSPAVLNAQAALAAAAARRDGYRAAGPGPGRPGPGADIAAVHRLTASGARLQAAVLDPEAKARLLRLLTGVWTAAGGTVIGVTARSGPAARLGATLQAPVTTLAAVLQTLERPPAGRAARVGQRTLLVLDDPGRIPVLELARVTAAVLAAGASLRLVGDRRQFAAPAAGPALRALLGAPDPAADPPDPARNRRRPVEPRAEPAWRPAPHRTRTSGKQTPGAVTGALTASLDRS